MTAFVALWELKCESVTASSLTHTVWRLRWGGVKGSSPIPARGWQCRDRTLSLTRPLVMGILNVTPDSFSDGGRLADCDAAVAHGLDLVAAGADILDIGGESTRPGATPVPVDEECRRVVPVIRELSRQCDRPLSVDTRKAAVAAAALEAGAVIVNDIQAGGDPEMAATVRRAGAGWVLMHMQGAPATMQQAPHYADVVAEVLSALQGRVAAAMAAGVPAACLAIDPGIGFGKTTAHNLELLAALTRFVALGHPVLVGLSRKRFIGELTGAAVDQRLAGSLAGLLWCAQQGVQILRVHDVGASCQALALTAALGSRRTGGA